MQRFNILQLLYFCCRMLKRLYTTTARLLHTSPWKVTSEDLSMLSHTFVKHSELYKTLAGMMALDVAFNQYLFSVQLSTQLSVMKKDLEEKTEKQLASLEEQLVERLAKIEGQLGQQPK